VLEREAHCTGYGDGHARPATLGLNFQLHTVLKIPLLRETHLTVCTTEPELPLMFEVPLYKAVTVVAPAGRVETVNFAFPPARLTVPKVPDAIVNVTVPTGTVVGDVTVAVNFTFCPKADGFGEEVNVVVVDAIFTIWVSTEDVLLLFTPSPL